MPHRQRRGPHRGRRSSFTIAQSLEARRLFSGAIFSPEVHPVANEYNLRVADLNGDGRADLINSGNLSRVSLLLNKDGAYLPKVDFVLNPNATVNNIDVADVNLDGKMDLIGVSSNASVAIAIALGRGDGTFATPVVRAASAGFDGYSVTARDVDGDAKPDLVLAGSQNSSIATQVILGNGDGTFAPTAATYSIAGVVNAGAVTTEDVNADGRPDILMPVSAATPSISIQLNLGGGTFAQATTIATAGYAYNLIAADVTNDGHADLITASRYPQNRGLIHVRPGDGSGTFTSAEVNYETEFPADTIAAGDINGDGRLDVAAGGASVGYATVYLGSADGLTRVFPPAAAGVFGAYQSYDIALADADGNGTLDLITQHARSDFDRFGSQPTVNIAYGDGTGRFLPRQFDADHAGTLVRPTGIASVETIDVDGDGQLDVVDASHADGNFSVAYRLPGGGFEAPVSYATAPGGSSGVHFGDFDGDGLHDAVFGAGDGKLRVLLNAGDRSFASPIVIEGTLSQTLTLADVNADGKLDIVTASRQITTLLGNGDGTFVRLADGPLLAAAPGYIAQQLEMADLNGDGALDVALTIRETSFGVLLAGVAIGQGDGSFAAARFLEGNGFKLPSRFALADLTGDGIAEMILSSTGSDSARTSVLQLVGQQWAYRPLGPITSSLTINGFDVGDVNGDGKPDLVIVRQSVRNYLEVHVGLGNGTFAPPRHFIVDDVFSPSNTVPSLDGIALGDFNLDGRLDAAVTSGADFRIIDGQSQLAIDTVTPTLAVRSFNPAGRKPVVRVTASEAIAVSSVSADDLRIENLTTGQTFVATGVVFGDGNREFTFTLPTSLPDGNYRFFMNVSAASDLAGNASAGVSFSDASTYVLAGDANRDRAVNFADLVILAQNYNKSGQTFAKGNLNYDTGGNVNFADLVLLAQRYNTSLAAVSANRVTNSVKPTRKATAELFA